MPNLHATLSPSDAERWTSCPAAIRLEAELGIEEEYSPFAFEGTLAHERAEIEAKHQLVHTNVTKKLEQLNAWSKSVKAAGFNEAEMDRHARRYVQHLMEQKELMGPGTSVLIEQRVYTGIEGCWGTADAILVNPEQVHIVDFKYGQGVRVEAEGNPQLKLYAVGALEEYGDLLGDVDRVLWSVHQPRLGNFSTAGCSSDELRAWRDSLKPVAKEALEGSDRFGPSPEACRWCPMAASCRARVEVLTAVDFATNPDLLEPEEIAELLPQLSSIKTWCDQLQQYALDEAYSRGHAIPGYKVVLSGGRRSIRDVAGAIEKFAAEGFDPSEVSQVKLRPLGDLEKASGGREALEDILGDILVPATGSPALVPDSDKRESINPANQAAKEFSEDE